MTPAFPLAAAQLAVVSQQVVTFLFLTVLLPPAVALVWLGTQFPEQDRTLLAQREAERRAARHVPALAQR